MEYMKETSPLETEEITDQETAENTVITELEELKAQRDQFRELAARAQAEGINYRNWSEKEFSRLKQMGSERAVLSMLPVLDNLERALDDDGDGATLYDGIRMVRDQFIAALTQLGVDVIDPVGEIFSPLEHDAVGMVAVENPEQNGTVVDVFQKGYKLNGRAIRPAQVRVGHLAQIGQESAQN